MLHDNDTAPKAKWALLSPRAPGSWAAEAAYHAVPLTDPTDSAPKQPGTPSTRLERVISKQRQASAAREPRGPSKAPGDGATPQGGDDLSLLRATSSNSILETLWRSPTSQENTDPALKERRARRKLSTEMLMNPDPGRETVMCFLESIAFQSFIAMSIVANAVVIGIETDKPDLGPWSAIEVGFLVIFIVELVLRIVGISCKMFFDSSDPDFAWNMFDFIIVSLGVVDAGFSMISRSISPSAAIIFRLVRLLRILRIFKIVRFLKQLYMLAYGFLEAAKAVFWVTILMFFALYICSVVLVRTVGHVDDSDPNQAFLQQQFGNVPLSMLSLFQLMSTPNIMTYEDLFGEYKILVAFLILFIIFGSFGMIALLTGVISESMFEKNAARMEEERREREQKHKNLTTSLAMLFEDAKLTDGTDATHQELSELLPDVAWLFEKHLVTFSQHDLDCLLETIDYSNSGRICKEAFCQAILSMAEGVRPMSVLEVYFSVSKVGAEVEAVRSELSRCMLELSQQTQQLMKHVSLECETLRQGYVSEATAREAMVASVRESFSESAKELRESVMEVVNSARQQPEDSAKGRASNPESQRPSAAAVEGQQLPQQLTEDADVNVDHALGKPSEDASKLATQLSELVSELKGLQLGERVCQLRERLRPHAAEVGQVTYEGQSLVNDGSVGGTGMKAEVLLDGLNEQLQRILTQRKQFIEHLEPEPDSKVCHLVAETHRLVQVLTERDHIGDVAHISSLIDQQVQSHSRLEQDISAIKLVVVGG